MSAIPEYWVRADEPWAPRLVTRGQWRSAAACRSADPELFFPISDSGPGEEQTARAKAICASCQVRRECLALALRTAQIHGIWAGTTEHERAAVRRHQRPVGPDDRYGQAVPRLTQKLADSAKLVIVGDSTPYRGCRCPQ